MSSVKIKKNLFWVGALDYNLRVFDVIMHTDYGTSYNSYILKTDEGAVLFETAKAKTFEEFINNVQEVCNLNEIKYIVLNHTEPDHAGSLEKLLSLTPNAKVLASQIALNFLSEICNMEIPGIAISEDNPIKIGNYTLNFLSVPFLHWPDSIYTFVPEIKALFSCDSFGCHYADKRVCNDLIEGNFVDAYKYYFNMIMGPFKSYVQNALKKIKDLDIETICPGHGPVLRENLDFYLTLYQKWSTEPPLKKKKKPNITIAYVSAYGYTKELAEKISQGISENIDADIESFDMVSANKNEVFDKIANSDGILFGTPTVNGDALPPISDLVNMLNGLVHGGKVAGAFGSYGWSGEGSDMLMARLNLTRMKTITPPLKAIFKPSDKELNNAYNYGQRFATKLKEEWIEAGTTSDGKTLWKCIVCGEIFEGALPPNICAVCGAGPEAFIEYKEEKISFSSDVEMNVMIIGSGPGAIYTADSLRKRNKRAQITILTNDDILPYYRPALTKQLADDLNINDILIFPASYYTENNIKVKLNTEITQIQQTKKEIIDANGQIYKYDKLIIATGAKCFVPPIRGANLQQVYTLRTFKDFKNLKNKLKESTKVTILGGGLLGLEAAFSISKLGKKVTVIEMAPRILPRQLDENASSMLLQKIQSSGIKVKICTFAEEISGDTKVRGVLTDHNEFIPSDTVIISAGIRSNIDLAVNAGIEVNRAIVVNDKMQTSHSDIYAVGDCAIYDGITSGLWETAIEQGKTAGTHIAGDKAKYSHLILGATMHAFNTAIFSVGDLGYDKNSKYIQVNCRNDIRGTYKNLFFKENKMVGALLLGDLSMTTPVLSGVKKALTPDEAKDNKLL
jgi:flavorubredoxin/NADPH-dependent 2,4-dienoyl-CoA reductase/sulfur reductase-like enzyme/rubredoxin